jgi:hypothetical protein
MDENCAFDMNHSAQNPRALGSVFPAFIACPSFASQQDKSGFPDGYDAVQAAPNSHKVIFENSLVRALEVTVPAPGIKGQSVLRESRRFIPQASAPGWHG